MLSRIIKKVEDEDFIFNYSNRSNASLIDDLGQLLLDLADKVRGGILVFFPSYSIQDEYHKVWEASEIVS